MNERKKQPDMFGGPPPETRTTRRTKKLNELPPTKIKPSDPNKPKGQVFTGLAPEENEGAPYERPEEQEAA